MSNTKLEDGFKEELTAIENWFRVLSDPERTACLYSLLKGTTPLQIRFFITVLQQMAAKDVSMDPLSASILMSQSHGINELTKRGLQVGNSRNAAAKDYQQSIMSEPNLFYALLRILKNLNSKTNACLVIRTHLALKKIGAPI